MEKRKYVLFDFDGVIADSWQVAYDTAKTVFPSIQEKSYRSMFEGNVYEAHEERVAKEKPERAADEDWFSIYTPMFEEKARLFPGIEKVIEDLSHDYILIIVSSTITSPIQGFLERHHIGRYFSEVMGADVHTSKHEKIQMIFKKYETSAKDCVFITDTLGDIREAKKAEVGAIGVAWGFHTKETLKEGEPFRIVDTPSDITASVREYFLHSSDKS